MRDKRVERSVKERTEHERDGEKRGWSTSREGREKREGIERAERIKREMTKGERTEER